MVISGSYYIPIIPLLQVGGSSESIGYLDPQGAQIPAQPTETTGEEAQAGTGSLAFGNLRKDV